MSTTHSVIAAIGIDIARFVPVVRTVTPVVAGTSRMHYRRGAARAMEPEPPTG